MYPAIAMYNHLTYSIFRRTYNCHPGTEERYTFLLFKEVGDLFKGHHNFADVINDIRKNKRSFFKLRNKIRLARDDANFEDPNHTDLQALELLNSVTIIMRDLLNPAYAKDVTELAEELKAYNE